MQQKRVQTPISETILWIIVPHLKSHRVVAREKSSVPRIHFLAQNACGHGDNELRPNVGNKLVNDIGLCSEEGLGGEPLWAGDTRNEKLGLHFQNSDCLYDDPAVVLSFLHMYKETESSILHVGEFENVCWEPFLFFPSNGANFFSKH